MQDAAPIRTRASHTHHHRHSTRDAKRTKGDANTQREGQCNSSHPPIAMPPTTTPHPVLPQWHPTIHDGPTHHHCEGRGTQRIPHHTKEYTHTTHHHHTPGNEQYMTRQQYSAALRWDE
jgi:hypothetical protein